jgi:hypothetical protein
MTHFDKKKNLGPLLCQTQPNQAYTVRNTVVPARGFLFKKINSN